MSDVFEFALREQQLAVDDQGRAETSVDVTSLLDRHERVTIEVDPRGEAERSWFRIEPQDVSLQTGETTSVTVVVEAPAGTPPADYEFALRAYAESLPQKDFTLSQVLTVSVREQTEPTGVKSWLLVLLAALALLLVGLAVWLVTRGSDEEPQAGGTPDNVIALPIGDAVAELDQDFVVDVFSDGTVSVADGCVLLQTPDPGTSAPDGTVALLTTECPAPRPVVRPPASLFALCQASIDFCVAVQRSYVDPPRNEDWSAASNAMAEQFVDTFTIEGTVVPNVIGLPNIEARAALLEAGFGSNGELDVGNATACRGEGNQNLGQPVLLQHPFSGVLAANGDEVTMVLTSCPDEANLATDVVVDSTIIIATFANLSTAVPEYHAAVFQDPDLGEDFLESAEASEIFTTMVSQFQQRFAVPRVPDIVGTANSTADSLVSSVGLQLIVPPQNIFALPGTCVNGVIRTQDPAAGTLVASVSDGTVNATADYSVGRCPFNNFGIDAVQLEVVTGAMLELATDE